MRIFSQRMSSETSVHLRQHAHRSSQSLTALVQLVWLDCTYLARHWLARLWSMCNLSAQSRLKLTSLTGIICWTIKSNNFKPMIRTTCRSLSLNEVWQICKKMLSSTNFSEPKCRVMWSKTALVFLNSTKDYPKTTNARSYFLSLARSAQTIPSIPASDYRPSSSAGTVLSWGILKKRVAWVILII